VQTMVKNAQIQRACIRFASAMPETGANRLQDYGVSILTSAAPGKSAARAKLELRERAQKLQAFVKETFDVNTVVGIGRTFYLDSINRDVLPKQAAADIFDSLLALLRSSLRVAVIAAVVLALISLLAGKPTRRAIEVSGPRVRAAATRVAADPRTGWMAAHKAAVQWGLVLLGGLVLVVWSNPTAWTVLIDAALIALAVWLVAALSRSAARPAA